MRVDLRDRSLRIKIKHSNLNLLQLAVTLENNATSPNGPTQKRAPNQTNY